MASTMNAIPLMDLGAQVQSLEPQLLEAIQSVIRDTDFILGARVRAFEEAFAAFTEVPWFVGVSSGTDALEQALLCLGVGPGDEVVTVPHTFIATVEAILSVGAKPVFVDVRPETLLMDVDQVPSVLTGRTKAVLPVHLYGQMVDMDPLMSLATARGLKVVEDCAQAHGARYRGLRAGSIGDLGAFSFYPGKNLGAFGDAGGVSGRKAEHAEFLRMSRNHGRKSKYEHAFSARNARMDGLQGAVLSVKLARLDAWNARRRELADRYDRLLAGVPGVEQLCRQEGQEAVHHLYVVRVQERDRVLQRLQALGVEAGVHYPLPLHLQPALMHLGYQSGQFPVCEKAAGEILTLPLWPEMGEDVQDQVVETLDGVIRGR